MGTCLQQHGSTYFATAVNYERKMFMKSVKNQTYEIERLRSRTKGERNTCIGFQAACTINMLQLLFTIVTCYNCYLRL